MRTIGMTKNGKKPPRDAQLPQRLVIGIFWRHLLIAESPMLEVLSLGHLGVTEDKSESCKISSLLGLNIHFLSSEFVNLGWAAR